MRIVHVVSVCFVRDECLLTVRKAGTARFMLPGGKPEPGETTEEAAVREVREELGIECGPLDELGHFESEAANEADTRVRSTTYVAAEAEVGEVRGMAEIEEVRWLPLDPPYPGDLAPLLVEHVLPTLRPRP